MTFPHPHTTAVRERAAFFYGVELVFRPSLDLRNRGSNDLAPRPPDDHIYGCPLVSDLPVRGCHIHHPGEPAGCIIHIQVVYELKLQAVSIPLCVQRQ